MLVTTIDYTIGTHPRVPTRTTRIDTNDSPKEVGSKHFDT